MPLRELSLFPLIIAFASEITTPWIIEIIFAVFKKPLHLRKMWDLIFPYDIIINIMTTLVTIGPLLILSVYYLTEIITFFGPYSKSLSENFSLLKFNLPCLITYLMYVLPYDDYENEYKYCL